MRSKGIVALLEALVATLGLAGMSPFTTGAIRRHQRT
jgi:hypothetical protein